MGGHDWSPPATRRVTSPPSSDPLGWIGTPVVPVPPVAGSTWTRAYSPPPSQDARRYRGSSRDAGRAPMFTTESGWLAIGVTVRPGQASSVYRPVATTDWQVMDSASSSAPETATDRVGPPSTWQFGATPARTSSWVPAGTPVKVAAPVAPTSRSTEPGESV